MKKLIVLTFILTGCMATGQLTKSPPSFKKMRCVMVDLKDPSVVGMVCDAKSAKEFGDYITTAEKWMSEAWTTCGTKDKENSDAGKTTTKNQNKESVRPSFH